MAHIRRQVNGLQRYTQAQTRAQGPVVADSDSDNESDQDATNALYWQAVDFLGGLGEDSDNDEIEQPQADEIICKYSTDKGSGSAKHSE